LHGRNVVQSLAEVVRHQFDEVHTHVSHNYAQSTHSDRERNKLQILSVEETIRHQGNRYEQQIVVHAALGLHQQNHKGCHKHHASHHYETEIVVGRVLLFVLIDVLQNVHNTLQNPILHYHV